jgi:hypothetical protein
MLCVLQEASGTAPTAQGIGKRAPGQLQLEGCWVCDQGSRPAGRSRGQQARP